MKNVSYNEIFNDTFCLEYLFEIKRNISDSENKLIINKIIYIVIAVYITEIHTFLDKEKLVSKKDFFNKPYGEIVNKKRHTILKSTIHSNLMSELISKMGIDFSKPVYDLSITISENDLTSINFALYREMLEYDDYIWSSLAILNKDICDAIINAYDCNKTSTELLQYMNENVLNICKEIETNNVLERYSYSAYKLFNDDIDLDELDKIFILFRYELIMSIIFLSKFIVDFSFEAIQNDEILLNASFKSFLIKLKSIIIHMIGKDFQKLDTAFAKKIKNQMVTAGIDDCFFRLNGLLRNNLHYSEITIFTPEQQVMLQEKQNKYIDILMNNFKSAIDIYLDEETINMTNFTQQCLNKGYSSEYVKEHYHFLYLKFLETNTI